ncbi:MUTL-like protein 1 [Pseudozyma hubeiensis]|nr:MUTL-like protein 1 [Pseudozyma hubeiensis]
MLLSPAVKTSYLNTMAGGSPTTPKRKTEDENVDVSPLSGKRARPTIPLRGSRSSSMFQVHQQQQQQQSPLSTPGSHFQQDPFASSSDVTLDDLTTSANNNQQQNQQRDIFTHSSASAKGKGAQAAASSVSFASNNPHWLKVVTSYGYTFIKSDELHLLEGNADVQMVIEPSNPAHQNEVPASPPAQMRFPMGVEFPPTPSPSDDGSGVAANRYFVQQHATAGKPLWEHVEGDFEAARAQQAQAAAGGLNEMMMDEW